MKMMPPKWAHFTKPERSLFTVSQSFFLMPGGLISAVYGGIGSVLQ